MSKSVLSAILLPLVISKVKRQSSANRRIWVRTRDALIQHMNDEQERLAVSQINIRGNNWGFGAIPKEIGRLENLKDLTLIDVGLDGVTLPPEIGELQNLKNLNISKCLIEEVPEEIGNLTSLLELNLSGNPVQSLPESIGNLTNLVKLRLHRTTIRTLPESIGNLTNLKFIDLGRTAIERLPDSISNLQSLKKLHIYSYNFVLDETIGNLSGLESLKVKGNITEIPFELGQLQNIREFSLTTINQITYPTKEILLNNWIPKGFNPSIAAMIVHRLPSSSTSIRRF